MLETESTTPKLHTLNRQIYRLKSFIEGEILIMKKKAFTLAEVLITLGIIGVIASLTLPSLTLNIQKQQTGPALAKAINTLETANALALQTENSRNLEELNISMGKSVTAYFSGALSNYVDLKKETAVTKKYYQYNGSTVYNFNGTPDAYTSKDGITFFHTTEGPTSLPANRLKTLGLGYGGKYFTVQIDTNGMNKGPNALGKDLFVVLVDTKGTVIPYGGAAWSAYTGNNILWTGNGCNNKKAHPTNPTSCAGAIADNGFQVKY